MVRIAEILEKGADKSGVMAAVSGAGITTVTGAKGAPTSKKAAAAAARASTPKTDAPKAAKPKAAPKAKAAPAAAAGSDDLKTLSGVGPALEKKLHAAGVTSFAQIAAWTPEDVAAMDEKLSFKGRIEREGWIAQAAELAKG